MRRIRSQVFRVVFAVALLRLTAVAPAETVREPAVAGLFYPAESARLGSLIDQLLDQAQSQRTGELKALICPHAGYAYSGPVAASAFRLLRGLHFNTVVVLGPAHFASLTQASVTGADVFRTPLGDVPVSPRARELSRHPPFALDPTCDVEPPEWASVAGRRGPTAMRAGTWEHSVEVEVPFLQRTLRCFSLVPVVMGNTDPVAAAKALGPFLDADTLLIVSSDLSHYHPDAEARRLDRGTVDAIGALDFHRMADQESCGRIPILTLLELAKERGWQPKLLDLRNSGDTAGDKSRVVGYAAVAFYAPPTPELSASDRAVLLQAARQSVRRAVAGINEETGNAARSQALAVPKAVFVTLTKHGQLRGCIGHLAPQTSLYEAVVDNARSAALRDPRFPPVTPREVDQLEIEISVLTEAKPLSFTSADDLLRQVRPGVDGVVLQIAAGGATYLPQVWEQVPDKIEFFDSLAVKAGGRPGDWRRAGTRVSTYQVVSFQESAPR